MPPTRRDWRPVSRPCTRTTRSASQTAISTVSTEPSVGHGFVPSTVYTAPPTSTTIHSRESILELIREEFRTLQQQSASYQSPSTTDFVVPFTSIATTSSIVTSVTTPVMSTIVGLGPLPTSYSWPPSTGILNES